MTASELLAELEAAGVELWADGEQLHYRAPAGALSSERLQALRELKPQLLAALTAQRLTPLSDQQRSFWLLGALDPGRIAAHEQFLLRIAAPVDRSQVASAWEQIVLRHDALHSRIVLDSGEPRQLADERLAAHSLCHRNQLLDDAALRALAQAEIERPFSLESGPLLRACLAPAPGGAAWLLVTAHHICADGLSVRIIRDELAALLAGQRLPPAPSYHAFARRQQQRPARRQRRASLDWWCRRLADMPTEIGLPRRAATSGRGRQRRRRLELSAATADALRALARAERATPFMLLLAGLRALLWRLSGQADFGIGSPVTARETGSERGLVGCLANNLVYRNPVDPQAGFRELLAAEREVVLAAWRHRELPLEELVAALQPPRRPDSHPLFQVLMLYEGPDRPPPGRRVELSSSTPDRESWWDLEWSFSDHGPGRPLELVLGYCDGLFEPAVAEALPARFAAVVEQLLAAPDRPLHEVDLLLPGERERLLAWGDGGPAVAAPAATLAELFDRAVAKHRSAIALIDGRRRWSYGELEARVTALAAALQDRGVGPGTRVGLALPRSAELVAAVLAVHRCAAVCLPLDPAQPPERLRHFLTLGEPELVLVEPGAGAAWARPAIELSADCWPAAAACETVSVTGEAPAFLLFTSGTTGKPKAAAGSHAQALARCAWMWRDFGFSERDRFAFRSSLNFIDAFWELYGALGVGAALVVVPDDRLRDGRRLAALLAREQVTHLVLVPTLLQELLDAVPELGQRLPALRLLISSGEALPPKLCARLRTAAPAIGLLNVYGTSETWDLSCAALSEAAPVVPIGRPIPGRRAYLLDEFGALVPPGMPGELFIGGIDAGAGYAGDPELTRERFLPDPFAGGRMYRSGDLARWQPDGQLQYLGRRDRQLKLAGQRVELGDIEAQLAGLPGVRRAAARLESGDRLRLLAWIEPETGARPDPGELRHALLQRLPIAAVPERIVQLERLPLLPNGKLDRASLTVPEDAPVAGRALTRLERSLAQLWSELLGRPVDRPDADFFQLGGQSLLATRMLAALQERFAVQITARDFFTDPTLAGLAAAVDGARNAAVSAPTRNGRGSRWHPLSAGQRRLWFLEQLDPGSPAYHIAFSIEIDGTVDAAALQSAIDDLLARHGSLRSVFRQHDGEPRVERLDDVPVELQRLAPDADLRPLLQQGFDIENGPLLRVALQATGQARWRLLLVLHHLIADGYSSAILFRELAQCYAARSQGRTPLLPPLPVDYADFVHWQAATLAPAAIEPELAYWREQLADAPPLLELPTDRPRPPEQRFRGAWLRRAWDADRLATLRAFASEERCSLFMLLLAAFQLLLARWSGQTDVLVGTPVAGRELPESQGLIGLFINSLVMRTRLDLAASGRELLAAVRDTVLAAQAHQRLPFESLVEALQPERSLSRAPLFQVLFNVTEIPELE
ncbi:MAG: amino acid adenylation domain-containing protein, partial [Gammaproteobacteria bacterium]